MVPTLCELIGSNDSLCGESDGVDVFQPKSYTFSEYHGCNLRADLDSNNFDTIYLVVEL